MGHLRRVEACAAAGAALIIVAVALTLAGCGSLSVPVFPPPPTSLPPWPSGASPSPAVAYPVQTATIGGTRAGCEGWRFKPTVDIEVSALGFYDDGRDGLRSPHRTAILDAASEKTVVETVVQGGSPLEGAFRWESVGPVVLEAGHEYAMVWDCPAPGDPQVLNPEDASLALELRYLGYGETAKSGPAWGRPETGVENAVLAGNFKYRPVAASSPSTQ